MTARRRDRAGGARPRRRRRLVPEQPRPESRGSRRAIARRSSATMTTAGAWTPTASTSRRSWPACWSWFAPASATWRSDRLSARVRQGRRALQAVTRARVRNDAAAALMRLRLGQPISDGTSGLYAVDRSALELLADDYLCEAPEVEALVRITDAKLRLARGAGPYASARARRVVLPRQAGGRPGGHDRDDAVRRARPSRAHQRHKRRRELVRGMRRNRRRPTLW